MLDRLLDASPLKEAHAIAKTHRQDIFLAGGAVRDLYLSGSAGSDFDFLVRGDSQSIAHHFAQTYGGTSFCLDQEREIFRAIIKNNQHLKTADFSNIFRGDLIADLMIRDFTINAIALNLKELFDKGNLTLIDPSGGIDDLNRRRIRVTSPDSFNQDPVRMLRAVRFSRKCNCTLLPETETLMKDQKGLLLTCPWERIRNEFFLILESTSGAVSSLKELDRLGLLSLLIPELEKMKGLEQGRHHDYTLWEHSLKTAYFAEYVLENGAAYFPNHCRTLAGYFSEELDPPITRKTVLIFAALLHDMGKPASRTAGHGEVHFINHDRLGMNINREICRRFRLSRKMTRVITAVTRHHMRPLYLHLLHTVSDRARFRLLRDISDAALDTLVVASADALASRSHATVAPQTAPPLLKTVSALMDCYCKELEQGTLTPLLNGNEIMEALHLKPGKEVGKLLEMVKEAEREGRITTREEARALVDAARGQACSSGEQGKLGDT